MASEWAIAIAILLPLLGAGGILATGRWPNLRESVTVATALATFGVVASLVEPVLAGERPQWSLLEVLPGVALAFEVEPLGMLYALVASGLWVPTALYAIGYCRGHGEENQTRFFACFALAIFAALGIAFSRNLFTLFFFYELLTLSTYPSLPTTEAPKPSRRDGPTWESCSRPRWGSSCSRSCGPGMPRERWSSGPVGSWLDMSRDLSWSSCWPFMYSVPARPP